MKPKTPNAKPMFKPMGAMKTGAINANASQNRLRDIMRMLSVKQHAVGNTPQTEKLGMQDGDESNIDQNDNALGSTDEGTGDMSEGDGAGFGGENSDEMDMPTTGSDSDSGPHPDMHGTNYAMDGEGGDPTEKPSLFGKPHKGMSVMIAIGRKRRGMA